MATNAFVPTRSATCAVVVDDDPDTADSLAMYLRLEGVTVCVAYTAEDALALVRLHRPTIVVTDLEMPRVSGLEEARRLRAMPEGAEICLVALTGNHALRQPAESAGFDHFFLKSGDTDKLSALVRQHCPASTERP